MNVHTQYSSEVARKAQEAQAERERRKDEFLAILSHDRLWLLGTLAIGAIGAVALGATSTDRDTREACYVIGAGLGGAAAAGRRQCATGAHRPRSQSIRHDRTDRKSVV